MAIGVNETDNIEPHPNNLDMWIIRHDMIDLARQAGVKDVWRLFGCKSDAAWVDKFSLENYWACKSILDSSCPVILLKILEARSK